MRHDNLKNVGHWVFDTSEAYRTVHLLNRVVVVARVYGSFFCGEI